MSSAEGRTVVRAEVPQVEIVRYAVDLRSFSHGAATFTRKFARHEPMLARLREIFYDHRDAHGRVTIEYQTELFYARPSYNS